MNRRYEFVAARAGHRCEYCRAPEAAFNFPFEVEHIYPTVAGGPDDESNLALACRSCNVLKAAFVTALDPESEESVPLFHPRRDSWQDHFGLDAETADLEGLSPTGRATLNRLRMNSDSQRTARRQWMRLGLFP